MQALTSQQRYLPFGEERAIPNSPILATDFGYTGQRLLDSGMGGIMDYKARFYSPMLGRFIQPDTIIPNESNPQSWNRFGYVMNNPIRFNDPTGHYCVGDFEDCIDGSGGTGPIPPVPPLGEGDPDDGGGGGNNICEGQPPYIPQYQCGLEVTDPGPITPVPPRDIVVGNDTYDAFEVEPYINGQPVRPVYTSRSRVVGGLDLFVTIFTLLHYNTDMYSKSTNSYTQGIIPYVYNKKTGEIAIGGVGVYNHTGYNLHINSALINDQPQAFSAPEIPGDAIGLVETNIFIVRYETSIQINFSAYLTAPNGVSTIYATGQIIYSGQIGP